MTAIDLAQQTTALETAIDALDLDELEDLASTLDSRTLRRIHKSLAEGLDSVRTTLEALTERLDALDIGEDEEEPAPEATA